ncbi:uncharacterized protein [Rutidosis leptorrhynchoides]|uniref:uncharacterized protein isoform X2 n=2 Tax=Rutidosis leptorrhynchoides TaxID=125765 RepID=UPI003A98D7F7
MMRTPLGSCPLLERFVNGPLMGATSAVEAIATIANDVSGGKENESLDIKVSLLNSFGDSFGWSDRTNLQTPPTYGNMGKAPHDAFKENYIQPGSLYVMELIAKEVLYGSIDIIFHIGDISYSNGFLGEPKVVHINEENLFLLCGRKVQDAPGKMLFAEIGMRTKWEKLKEIFSGKGENETPLQVKLNSPYYNW